MTFIELQKLIKFCTQNGVTKIEFDGVKLELDAIIRKKVRKAPLRKEDKEEIMDRLLLDDPLQREEMLERQMMEG